MEPGHLGLNTIRILTLSGILTVMFFGHSPMAAHALPLKPRPRLRFLDRGRSGVPVDEVSDYCGVSIQIIKTVYGHHIPGGFDDVLASSNRLGRSATATQQIQAK